MNGSIKKVVIAVDIGTTSTKAIIVAENGAIKASASAKYPLHVPKPGYAEQDPDEIAEAVIKAVRRARVEAELMDSEIHCISFSSAMHSLIALDSFGKPLTQCITWADQRSVELANQLKASEAGLQIYSKTGTPIHPMSPLCKLMWMRVYDRAVFQQAVKFVGIKEYIMYQWFGQYAVDYSIASATGLFNLEALNWDEQALALAGVSKDQLSVPVPTTTVYKGIKSGVLEQLDLQEDIPVVIGASDGVLANLGLGILDNKVAAVTIGTSGAVRTTVNKPLTHPNGDLFCYCLTEDYWVTGGAVNNGGVALQWIQELLNHEEGRSAERSDQDILVLMNDWAEAAPPGSEGLICVPLFTGERAPYYNANARGVFFGLTLSHKQQHMVRSVMEGVMFQIESVLRSVEEVSGELSELWSSGGFANSLLWRQMLADITGVYTQVPNDIESSGLGAAKLGLYALGVSDTINPLWNDEQASSYTVNPDYHRIYQTLLPIYRKVYANLVESFDEISQFQKEHHNYM
jgi:gluconokinase